MKTSFKCLPYGDLPYETVDQATAMILKIFESVPFLAFLPCNSTRDDLIHRTLDHVPGIRYKDKRILLKNDLSSFKQELVFLEEVYNEPSSENIDRFKFDSVFLERYLQIIKRLKPKETVVNLLGPFTISQTLENKEGTQLLADKFFRKFIIQVLCAKALWVASQIRKNSAKTRPIIIFEEPLLYKAGEVRRENEDVTRDTIINLFFKIAQKLNENNIAVGIQCFEKCDWTIPIEAGVNVISFNAYDNPNNLSIIPEQVNGFLCSGGRINWAIVPTKTESLVKSINIDFCYDHLIKAIEGLVDSGVSERLAYNGASVSIQGNVDKLPIIFAEKAVILAAQLSKKIPVKR